MMYICLCQIRNKFKHLRKGLFLLHLPNIYYHFKIDFKAQGALLSTHWVRDIILGTGREEGDLEGKGAFFASLLEFITEQGENAQSYRD